MWQQSFADRHVTYVAIFLYMKTCLRHDQQDRAAGGAANGRRHGHVCGGRPHCAQEVRGHVHSDSLAAGAHQAAGRRAHMPLGGDLVAFSSRGFCRMACCAPPRRL